ncbi:hypothetical protein CHS0354_037400 [Potamilus streckersoni]|uniref:Zinc finger C3H1 domain-containing protein n=1 Tax=Potamilus streckersoni TaxID=2493646 RepID=A0AAE0RRT9_9BIVA|nr:hypothetical protein CHS0354_037400 [Potamilus streckersoni]
MDILNNIKQKEDSVKEEGELSDDVDEEPKENVPFVGSFSRSQPWTGLHTNGRSSRGRRKANQNAHPHPILVPETYSRPSNRDFSKRVSNYGRPNFRGRSPSTHLASRIPSLMEISTDIYPQRQPLPPQQYLRERLPSHYENWQGGNRVHNSPSSRLWERRRLRPVSLGRNARDSARDASRSENDDSTDFEALLETYRHIQEQLASLNQEDTSIGEGEKEEEETKGENSNQTEYEAKNSSKNDSEIIAAVKEENVSEQPVTEKKMEEEDEEEEELDLQELRRIALASKEANARKREQALIEEREKAKAEAHAAAVVEEEKKSMQAKDEKIAHIHEEKRKSKTNFASNISRDDQRISTTQYRKPTLRNISGSGRRNPYRDRERRPVQYSSRHQAHRPTTKWRKPSELECRQFDERRRQQESNVERKRQESARLKQEFQTREIQKILTLDDPEEQVQRFLKLLDRKDFISKNKSPTLQSGEQRFPGDKIQPAVKQELMVPVTELKDNYEEVEMDIDSEPSSPVMTTEVSVELQLEPDFFSAMQPVGYLRMEEMSLPYSSVWLGTVPVHHHYPQLYQPHHFQQAYLNLSEPFVLPPLLPEEPPLNPPLPTEPPPPLEQPPPPPSEDFKPPLPLEPPPPPPPPEEPPEDESVKVAPIEAETYARQIHINHSGTKSDVTKLNSSAGSNDFGQSIDQVLAEVRKQSVIEQDRRPNLHFIQSIDMTKQQSILPADTQKLLPPPPPPLKSSQTDVTIQKESSSADELIQQSIQNPADPLTADKCDKEDDDEADMLRKQLLKTIATKRKKEGLKVTPPSHMTGRIVSDAELQQDFSGIQEGTSSDTQFTTKGDYSPSSSGSNSPVPTVAIPKITQPKTILRQQQIQQLMNLPVHKPVVINLGEDSSDDEEETVTLPGAYQKSNSLLSDLDLLIKEARQSAQSLQQPQTGWNVGKKQPGQAEHWKMRETMRHKVHQYEEEHLKMGKGITQDQVLLRTLVEKATKYLKSLKVSEAKVEKLTEQLAAAEKIALANKEQLEKAKKQARLVKDRLLNKKKEYEVLERTLLQVGREAFGEQYSLKTSSGETMSPKRKFVPEAGTIETGIKRKNLRQMENLRITIPNQPQKKPVAIKMSAEDIARKKEQLQKLAEEYEKRLRLLRQEQLEQEMKAKENTRPVKVIIKPIKEIPRLEVIELDTVTEVLEEEKPNSRRRSLLEINPSTKPNITMDDNKSSRIDSNTSCYVDKDQTAWCMPEGEALSRLCEMQLHRTDEVLHSLSEEPFVPSLSSQNLTALLPHCKEIPGLHLWKKETLQVQNTDVHQHVEFTYRSPLLHFKAYRFSPYFRTRENLSLSSITFCNKILPKKMLCHFDIQGTCHDENCKGQHQGHYSMSEKEILQDIVSYCPEIAGVTRATPVVKYSKIIADYVDSWLKQHQGRLRINEMCLFLISQIKEWKKKNNSNSLLFESRAWKPVMESKLEDTDMKPLEKEFKTKPKTSYVVVCKEPMRRGEAQLVAKKTLDERLHVYKVKDEEFACCTDVSTVMDTETGEQDIRYYGSGTDFQVLEEAVLENPLDEQLWMKLARRKLNNSKQSPDMCLDHALNVLARGVEANKCSFDLWYQYLTLYSRHSEATDLASMCHTALQYVRHRKIFWLYIHALGTVHKKDEGCVDLIHYLKEQSHSTDIVSSAKDVLDIPSPSNSHYLLEAVLYRVGLSITAGRYSQGLQIAQEALETINVIENLSSSSPSQTLVLNLEDRTVLWLSYCHLKAFRTLPPQLFDPAHPMSGRIVCKDSLIFPWLKISKEKNLVEEVLADLRRAIQACLYDIPEEAPLPRQTLPLYQNLIYLLQTQTRFEEALNVCREILMNDPTLVEVWLIVANLYAMSGSTEATRQVFSDALEANPFSATVYYHAALYEMKQGENGKALVELEKCALSFFDIDVNEEGDPNNAYCDILEQLLPQNYKPVPYKPEVSVGTIKEEKLYLWINFCLLLELQGDTAQALDMYETALNSFTDVDHVTKIWLSYLEYQYRRIHMKSGNIADSQKFTSLFQRCLMTLPSKFPVPHHSGEFWQSYSHVNQVINFCLSCLPPDSWSTTLEKILTLMPTNIQLVLRACKELLDEDNTHSARIMCNPLVFDNTASIQIWKLVISLATKQKNSKEIRKLFHRAVKAVPFSSELWNDFLLFEVTEGQRSKDVAMEILSQCQDLGVSVDKSILFGIQNRT